MDESIADALGRHIKREISGVFLGLDSLRFSMSIAYFGVAAHW